MEQRRLRAITLQGAIEKNDNFDITIIISYSACTNNIYADCIKNGNKGLFQRLSNFKEEEFFRICVKID